MYMVTFSFSQKGKEIIDPVVNSTHSLVQFFVYAFNLLFNFLSDSQLESNFKGCYRVIVALHVWQNESKLGLGGKPF
jgi:hypothetical protein